MPFSDEWATYASLVVPVPKETVQYAETQKAFYAGAFALLGRLMSVSRLDPQTGQAIMAEIESELMGYFRNRSEPPKDDGLKTSIFRNVARRLTLGKLRCESNGWDDASCLAMFEVFETTRDIAIAWYRHFQSKGAPNREALGFALLAHQAALGSFLKEAKQS